MVVQNLPSTWNTQQDCLLFGTADERKIVPLTIHLKFDHDGHTQTRAERTSLRRPNVIDPTLVRTAQLSDIKVLNKPRDFVVKMFSQQSLLLLQNKVQKAILVVNHMLAHVINWIKWIGKLIVRTMRHFCLAEFKEATVKRVTKEG